MDGYLRRGSGRELGGWLFLWFGYIARCGTRSTAISRSFEQSVPHIFIITSKLSGPTLSAKSITPGSATLQQEFHPRTPLGASYAVSFTPLYSPGCRVSCCYLVRFALAGICQVPDHASDCWFADDSSGMRERSNQRPHWTS